MKRRRRLWFWLGLAVFFGPFSWFAGGLFGALAVTAPAPSAVPHRRELAGRAVEPVATTCDDGTELHGWLVRAAEDSTRCVVFAPGIHGNRLAVLERARWYLEHGWSTLLVDLRGTGESSPTRISLGWHEAQDLLRWRALLRGRGFEHIAAHGESLGAAAIVYGDGDWDFAVLEGCYRDIDAALAARVPWLPAANVLLWPMRFWTGFVADLDADELRPIDHIDRLRCPTLLLFGADDAKVGAHAAEDLLARSGAADKRLITIPGAHHQDLFAFDRERVTAALQSFVPGAR